VVKISNHLKNATILFAEYLTKLNKSTLKTLIFKQGNRSDAIGFDLAKTFTRLALECTDHVSVKIESKKIIT
jgi:hypothetical protein